MPNKPSTATSPLRRGFATGNNEESDLFRAYLHRFPTGMDFDLLVLKAHLFIECEINKLIAAKLPNANVLLRDERLQSAYRIRIAQALFEPGHMPELWAALMGLNKLRNHVAHSIDVDKRDQLILDTTELVGVGEAPELRGKLELFVWVLFVNVTGLRGVGFGRTLLEVELSKFAPDEE